MFGRKKHRDEQKKKRHKPGMTQDEISKLEEVGIRRGFFSKKTSKRDKDEPVQKRDISRPLSLQFHEGAGGDIELPSVLQRATMYGQVIPQRRTSVTSPVSPKPPFDLAANPVVRQNKDGNIQHPVPPVRRKLSTKTKATPPYDVPKPPVLASNEGYSTPHIWKQPSKEALLQTSKQPPHAPPIKPKPMHQRTVVLKKRTSGDFGVSLRRSAMIEYINNREIKRTVYFAEPGHAMLADMESGDDRTSRLYAGDRLIQIDGVNVEIASRDEIVSRIKNAGSKVTLVVQSMKDVDEVSLADSQDSQYSTPRKPDGIIHVDARSDHMTYAKDDGNPRLPAAKKQELKEREKTLAEKCQITRQRSWNDDMSIAAESSSSKESASLEQPRSVSVCFGSVSQQVKKAASEVTPSELHASSMLSDPIEEEKINAKEPAKMEEKLEPVAPVKEEEPQLIMEDVKSVKNETTSKDANNNVPVSTDETTVAKTIIKESDAAEDASALRKDEPDAPSEISMEPTPPEEVAPATTSAALNSEPGANATEPTNDTTEVLIDNPSKSDPSIEEAPLCDKVETKEMNISEEDSSEVVKQEEPHQNGLPEIVHIESKPGVTWKQTEKVWFRTADGISDAYIVVPDAAGGDVDNVPDGKTRIEMVQSKEVVLVPEDDVEMANEPQFDRAGDVTTLRHLNESSMLHTLSQRYEGALMYSFAGPHLISIRLPYQYAAGSSNFTQKMKQTYKGSRFGDTPAHLYAIAQHAYQDMMASLSDQCIMSLGFTGSGKTNNTQNILNYFATVGASIHSQLTVEKVTSVVSVFESFSSSATKHCKSASRCVHVYNLDFDRTGQLAAMSVQALLLERSRLVKRTEGEASFNIFYQLLHGADTQLRRELFLLDLEQESNPLIINGFSSDPTFHQMSVKGFAALQNSFNLLKFSQDEIKAIYYVLAACLHLGMAGSQKVNGNKYQFARADSAQKAASLLGISADNISKLIFQSSSGKRSRTSSSASLKRSTSSLSSMNNFAYQGEEVKESGQQCLDTFIIGLYSEVFRSVVSLINREMSSSQRAQNTILVVDAPGYQGTDAATTGQPASYSDLTFNYVQDRLHALFHYNAFTVFKDRYQQEDIDCDVIVPEDNFSSSVEVVDQPPSIGSVGAKGLLWLLDEEAASPGATDESFIERLLLHYSKPQKENAVSVVQRSANKGRFILQHQAGACSVEYDATGWLRFAHYNSTVSNASEVLQDSKKSYISELFGSGGEKLHGSVASLKLDGGSSNLKRASSFRKAWSSTTGAAAAVKKSMCLLTKFQTDGLVDMLKRAQPHFILSFTPHATVTDKQSQKLSVDVAAVRNQLRGFQLLDAARTLKQGYPEHIVFGDFRRRFDVLLRQLSSNLPSNSTTVALMEDKEATENILKHVELSRSQFRIGASQVFFRSGVLNMLEDRRNEKVQDVMIEFQARCRGYLARKRFERRKVQVVAVRCIQRNIRKFMAIRQWPWWRLLTKVLPLVEVTRTEEELREKQAEFDLLKEKFDRTQSERDDLKLANVKYETKLHDVMLLLEEERTTASHASDLLEHERKERLRLERVMKDTQFSHGELQSRVEMMEVELAEKRLMYSEHVMMDSDEEIEDGEYKAKYEKVVREFNFQTKRKAQEYEDSLEEARADKKAVDRKLMQMQEELEDQRRVEHQNRKKLQRLHAELSDAKIHLEETSAKNHDLEKKQRKFDSELYGLQATVTDLKTSRDRVQREKDKILLERKDLEKEVDDKADEIDNSNHKIRRLEEELEDNSTRDTDDRQMVNSLKKNIRELEAKAKDQEEELEEQASTIHTLEQARERLEMSSEQARQHRQREVESKEDELEEMRSSYHKKIKQLELQLEEADEERATMSKQKRDLEQEVKAARDSGPQGHDIEMEKRLRRDLKRYKALLADAQTMIDHLKADVVSKQQMRQLKAQLEDLQYTSSAAVKSRKTIELEVEDLQAQLEEISKAKQDSESRVSGLQREAHELRSKLEEDAEDSQETLRKYKQLVGQQGDDRRQLVEAQANVEELRHEKMLLDEKISGLQGQIQYLEGNTTDNATLGRLESKAKDLEMKLEFQKTANRRLEVQLTRAKENLDKIMSERDSHIAGEHREKEALKRVQRQLREAKEEQGDLLKREQEALQKKHDLDMELGEHQNQIESLQSDLKLAFKRISDLQIALEELEESDVSDEGDSMSSSDEDDDFTSAKYGWRSRLSTSGYSGRARTRSSLTASSRSSSIDYETSHLNSSRNESVFHNADDMS